MLYEFEMDHNAAEATKNICCGKGEGAVDHNAVTRWFKKLCLDQVRSGKPKTVDSKAVFQVIETNPELNLASKSP